MKDGKHVILCVDDDPDILSFLGVVLESAGYLTVKAESAEEGLKRYRETDPDLVIVDMMMEEVVAGVGFIKELNALGNAAPIYIFSAVGDDFAEAPGYEELGLAGVFQKPVTSEQLLSVVRSKLG